MRQREKLSPISPRLMSGVVILGLTGQLAWTVENMYLNVFIFETLTDSPHVIALMVALGALTATLATLFLGAWSDRAGTRRPFIVIGYLLWGAVTATFGLVHAGPGMAIAGAVTAIILLDCVMSFFGAGANDAAFNAWVTDNTDDSNRGRIDAVLQIMPMVAMLVVFGALDPLTKDGHWFLFFAIIGICTAGIGVLAWPLAKDAPTLKKSTEGYFSSVILGLRPSSIRRNPSLYLTLAAWAIIGTSTQVFLPYIIVYLQRRLQIDAYALVLAAVIISASILSVLGGRIIDRVGKVRSILPATAIMIAGYLGMFFARTTWPVILCGTIMFAGFMLSVAAIAAEVRDNTPAQHAGMVQGLRMIAMVLIPMWIGPTVGATVISSAAETYTDLGQVKQVPTPWIFIAAAVVALFVLVPMAGLRYIQKHDVHTVGQDPRSSSPSA